MENKKFDDNSVEVTKTSKQIISKEELLRRKAVLEDALAENAEQLKLLE